MSAVVGEVWSTDCIEHSSNAVSTADKIAKALVAQQPVALAVTHLGSRTCDDPLRFAAATFGDGFAEFADDSYRRQALCSRIVA